MQRLLMQIYSFPPKIPIPDSPLLKKHPFVYAIPPFVQEAGAFA